MSNKVEDKNIIIQYHKKIKYIIIEARSNAIKAVDFNRVLMYWKIGELIVTELEKSDDYKYVSSISKSLELEFGSGFSKRIMQMARQFYILYPETNALRSHISWTQYRSLIRIEDEFKRKFYENELTKNNWSSRDLERQINSLLFERLLKSNDKEVLLKLSNADLEYSDPRQIIKDPMVLEFLELEDNNLYHEKDLETALISNIEKFLLELGNGFTFVARQKRITLEDDEFFVDLVFYNRILRSHVIIELKTRKLKHSDLGQLQMYVNYFDREERLEHENKTIGILLCTSKNDKLVKYSLPENNDTIIASKYELVLPSEKKLLDEISKVVKNAEAGYE